MLPAYPPGLDLRTAHMSKDIGLSILAWRQSLHRSVRESEGCGLQRSSVTLLFCRALSGPARRIVSSRGGAITLECLRPLHHGMHPQVYKYNRLSRSLLIVSLVVEHLGKCFFLVFT